MAFALSTLLANKGRLLSGAFALLSAGGFTLVSLNIPGCDGTPKLSPFPESRTFVPAVNVTQINDGPDAMLGMLADPREAWAWPDRALVLNQVFAGAPPDRGFPVGDVEAWMWESQDRHVRIVEPLEVGVREYYFAPGADEPFFVRDPDYGYGFNNGVLVVVIDRGGQVLAPDRMIVFADPAGRYLHRGRTVVVASRGRERWRVTPDRWAQSAPVIQAESAQWTEAAAAQPGWRAYRDQSRDAAHFEAERGRRQASARRSQADYARQTRERRAPAGASFTSGPAQPRRWAEVERRDRRAAASPEPIARDRPVLDFDGRRTPEGRPAPVDVRPDRRRDRPFASDTPRGARGQDDWRRGRDAAREARRDARGDESLGRGAERRQADLAARREREALDQRRGRAEAGAQRRQAEAEQRRQASEQRRMAEGEQRRQAMESRRAEAEQRRRADDSARQQAAEQRRMQAQMDQERRRAEREAERAQRRASDGDDDDGNGRRRRRRDGG